jgi:hypothetical protein
VSHNLSHEPDQNERDVRDRLIGLIDGPDATPPPAVPPMPRQRPRDWLDDILDSEAAPAPSGPQPLPGPVYKTKPAPESDRPADAPKPSTKPRRIRVHGEERDDPRQSLLDALDRTPRRVRWLIYHGTAAGAGWWLDWVNWSTDTAAWYAAGHWTAPSAWVLYGLGACACGLYRRSRGWAWPFAWAAAVPVSSVVVGVLLYGTGYQP